MTNQEIVYIIAICVLMICAVTDWLSQQIWVPIVVCPVQVMLFLLKGNGIDVWKNIVAYLVVTSAFLFFYFISKGQIGKGDSILFGIVSIGLEWWQILSVLFISFTMAGFFGVYLMVMRKKNRKYRIPLAPFVMAGYVFTLAMGYI